MSFANHPQTGIAGHTTRTNSTGSGNRVPELVSTDQDAEQTKGLNYIGMCR
jgi:hypothetical protein